MTLFLKNCWKVPISKYQYHIHKQDLWKSNGKNENPNKERHKINGKEWMQSRNIKLEWNEINLTVKEKEKQIMSLKKLII